MTHKLKPEMSAMILAGGLGTRLRTEIHGKPKALAPVYKRPFLSCLLDYLAEWGFSHVILCVGFLSDLIVETYGNSYKKMQLDYAVENEPLGTGGAIRNAYPMIRTEDVLVMNGDSFHPVDLQKFKEFCIGVNASAALTLLPSNDCSRFGTVSVNKRGEISSFQEKTGLSQSGLINAGIYLIKKKLISSIPSGKQISIEKDIFPSWIQVGGKYEKVSNSSFPRKQESGENNILLDSHFHGNEEKLHSRTFSISGGLYGFISEGQFIDIGTPESYRRAEEFFKAMESA